MSEEPERCTLEKGIRTDQREYIEAIRKWLHEPLTGKGKMVGGCTCGSGLAYKDCCGRKEKE